MLTEDELAPSDYASSTFPHLRRQPRHLSLFLVHLPDRNEAASMGC
jgi:hypothetical protein